MAQMRRRKMLEQMKQQNADSNATVQLPEAFTRWLAASAQNAQPVQDEKAEKHEDSGKQINLTELFWRIVSKFGWIVLGAVLGTAILAIYAYTLYTPQYTAVSKLYIVSNSSSVINMSDLQIGTALTTDYTEVFKTHEVSEMTMQILKDEYGVEGFTYGQLQGMLTVSNPSGSRVLYLTVKHKNADTCQQVADSFALAGQRFITERMRTDEPTSFSVAMTPGSPSTMAKSKLVIIGFVVGTLLALGIIVLQFLLDDKPRTAEDIYKCSGLSTLGTIPLASDEKDNMKKEKKQRDRSNANHRKEAAKHA